MGCADVSLRVHMLQQVRRDYGWWFARALCLVDILFYVVSLELLFRFIVLYDLTVRGPDSFNVVSHCGGRFEPLFM